jgi:hypothetical protein
MFKDTCGKGFQMTFSNGNTISVQYGYGNYCESKMKNYPKENVNLWVHFVESKDAEIAVWDKEGNWITSNFIDCGGDDVKGYLSADEVLDIMNKVAGK